jgi:hypothetical protein
MQTAEAKDWPLFIGRLLQVILGASLDKRAAHPKIFEEKLHTIISNLQLFFKYFWEHHMITE